MERVTKTITLSLPPEMEDKIKELMKEEGRTRKNKVSVIKENDDNNRILECAIEGRVQYLISGDRKHLLRLKEYQGTKILSPAEVLKVLFL